MWSLTHCESRLLIQIHIRIQARLSPNSNPDPRSLIRIQAWYCETKNLANIQLTILHHRTLFTICIFFFLCELVSNSRRSLLSFKEDFLAGKFIIFPHLETILAFLDPAPLTQFNLGSATLYIYKTVPCFKNPTFPHKHIR